MSKIENPNEDAATGIDYIWELIPSHSPLHPAYTEFQMAITSEWGGETKEPCTYCERECSVINHVNPVSLKQADGEIIPFNELSEDIQEILNRSRKKINQCLTCIYKRSKPLDDSAS